MLQERAESLHNHSSFIHLMNALHFIQVWSHYLRRSNIWHRSLDRTTNCRRFAFKKMFSLSQTTLEERTNQFPPPWDALKILNGSLNFNSVVLKGQEWTNMIIISTLDVVFNQLFGSKSFCFCLMGHSSIYILIFFTTCAVQFHLDCLKSHVKYMYRI